GRGPAQILSDAGLQPKRDEIRVVHDTLYLPVDSSKRRVELEFRVLGYGASPTFTSGRNLGTTVTVDTTFSDALGELIAPGSRLDRALGSAGWQIAHEHTRADGFRLESNGAAIDLVVAPMGAQERAFMKHRGIGVVYSVPHDHSDRSGEPAVLQLI